MLYKDLVQFTPIETVIQLHDAENESAAKNLVETYVISETMANKLVDLAFPQLQLDNPQDNKGILIVGNYGTGKSHLMSVISAVAERAELTESLTNSKVKEAAKGFAGKYKVLRVEIGSVTGSLRDILLAELEAALKSWGVSFTFPSANEVPNNKVALIQAMDAFREKYPDQGVLLVVDELLDYLRTREQRALILDLGFLRELGEVGASCSFRFIGGLQETLFENPRFSFVAEQLRRVKDRFEEILIAKEDITFVVSERLLKKTDKQKAWISDYLRKFTPLYKSMAERLDEFVDLFPIHPAYIETFENLAIAEKRQVLRTFSLAIRSIFNQEVPENEPGLISYDHYWPMIQDDPSLRSIDDIARVIEKSNVLEGLIKNAYTRPNLKEIALRIIHALSVQRLTTQNIYLPVGVTAEYLRDSLCLYVRLPEENSTADFLLDQVQVALKEIIKTVQGQFISYNPENGQYYLDLKKAVDFDQKIQERGDSIDKSDLNIYFYDALQKALNLSDTTYLTGYTIWFYELPWNDHNVTRPGYFFFGPPDERTTAQPPRDFYLFFLPPFLEREIHDEKQPDEVIFKLTELDQEFETKVRQYAGARAMANESTEYQTEYTNKADSAFRQLILWLQKNLIEKLHVIYQGVDEPLQKVLMQMRSTASQNLEELIRLVGSHLLSPQFEDLYPDYPKFKRLRQPITEKSRPTAASEAFRTLIGRRTELGLGVLDGLSLLDAQNNVRPENSPYARYFLKLLTEKPAPQVVNRGEIIETVSEGLQPIEKDLYFKLEPEWVAVILLALVYNGDIVLNLNGHDELDTSSLERSLTRPITDFTNFRFYKRPTNVPTERWVRIFEGLGLQPGLIRDENTREAAIKELLRLVKAELDQLGILQHRLEEGLRLWNEPILTTQVTYISEDGIVVASDAPEFALSLSELQPSLRGYKQFLDELSKYNMTGKLRNLDKSVQDIDDYLEYRKNVFRIKEMLSFIDQLQSDTTYLAEAQANLPVNHDWSQRAMHVKSKLLQSLRRFGKTGEGFDLETAKRELHTLKNDYIKVYSDLHRRMVLNAEEDARRQKLYHDPRFEALQALSSIDLLNHGREFESWKKRLAGLLACPDFHERKIADNPTCPSCNFRPAAHPEMLEIDAALLLSQLEDQLSDMLTNWRKALRANLQSETAQKSLAAMSPAERKPIEEFLAQSDNEESLPENFVPQAIQALRGIQALTLPVDSLLQALKAGGLPCTPQELQQRFNQFLSEQMRGHDAGNTRITLNQ